VVRRRKMRRGKGVIRGCLVGQEKHASGRGKTKGELVRKREDLWASDIARRTGEKGVEVAYLQAREDPRKLRGKGQVGKESEAVSVGREAMQIGNMG